MAEHVDVARILTAEDMETLDIHGEGNGIQALLDSVVGQPEMLRDRTQLTGGRGLILALSTRRRLEGADVVNRLVAYGTRVLSGQIAEGINLSKEGIRELLITNASAVVQLYDHYAADTHHLFAPAIQQEIAKIPQMSAQYGLSPEMAPRVVDRFTRLTASPAPKPS